MALTDTKLRGIKATGERREYPDRDVADPEQLGDHALAGVAQAMEQHRQRPHRRRLAALRRGGEVAAARLAAVALVTSRRAVLDERRPSAPPAADLAHGVPPPSLGRTLVSVHLSRRKCL